MADVSALEHSTLKVPYETLNKKFRLAQKTIDREVSHVQHACEALQTALQGETVPAASLAPVVTALLDKLRDLQQRARRSVADEGAAAALLKGRLDHLRVPVDAATSPAAFDQWRRNRVDRLLVDYLLRVGYYETAQRLAAKSGVAFMSNLDVFLMAREVEASLERHELARCLEWCHDNKSKLRRLGSRLELLARRQEFVELVRAERTRDAVQYARKWFSTLDAALWDADLRSAVALLAFGAHCRLKPYARLFIDERWADLIGVFREENRRVFQLPLQSVFSGCMQCGLAALKTPYCSSASAPTGRARHCPVCLPDVRALAEPLPIAHASQSRLICAISGRPLDENNPPMMLPNGFVYGQSALEKMATERDGSINCPRTGAVYSFDQLVRVFVM